MAAGEIKMVALKESDLRAILGEDYRAKQDEFDKASGLDANERAALARIASLDSRKGPVLCSAFLGLLLLVATKYSATPTAAEIQTYIASGLIIGGLATFFWLRHEVSKSPISPTA